MRSLSYALIQALRADVDSILQALRVPAHDPAFSDRHGAEDSTFVFYSLGYVDRSVERFHLTTREASALPKHLAAVRRQCKYFAGMALYIFTYAKVHFLNCFSCCS